MSHARTCVRSLPRWQATMVIKCSGEDYDSDEWDGELLDAEKFDSEAVIGTVSVGLGLTLNLGNYESAKMDVHVSWPFDARKPNAADSAYQKAYSFATTKIQEVKTKVRGSTATPSR